MIEYSKLEIDSFLSLSEEIPVLDVRSPGEFLEGHIPGSINIPLLTDDQRREIGTIYKQKGNETAVLKGFELVGPEFEDKAKKMLEQSKSGRLRIYCWRGGMRSEIMSWIASLVNVKTDILKGGYKAYRNRVLSEFRKERIGLVLSGATGSGKTEILKFLKSRGIHTVDLEAAACHRGSSFGAIGMPERTQEMFENDLAFQLMAIPTDEPFVVEDESRMIGRKCIPLDFFNQMSQFDKIWLQVDLTVRVQRILLDYAQLDKAELELAIRRIEKRLGNERTRRAIEALKAGDHEVWIQEVLAYYDKSYKHLNSEIQNMEFMDFNWSDVNHSVDKLLNAKAWKNLKLN